MDLYPPIALFTAHPNSMSSTPSKLLRNQHLQLQLARGGDAFVRGEFLVSIIFCVWGRVLDVFRLLMRVGGRWLYLRTRHGCHSRGLVSFLYHCLRLARRHVSSYLVLPLQGLGLLPRTFALLFALSCFGVVWCEFRVAICVRPSVVSLWGVC